MCIYYNPDGGTYFHAERNCATMSEYVQKKLVSAPYTDLLSTLLTLTPCMQCTAGSTMWYGEAEVREAWPILVRQLYAEGLYPYACVAWVITPDKDQISICVLMDDNRLAKCVLVPGHQTWQVQQLDWLPTRE